MTPIVNFNPDRSAAAGAEAAPSRRALMAMLASAPASAACLTRTSESTKSEALPTGPQAAAIALQATTAGWVPPTFFAGAVYQSWKRRALEQLLRSYSDIYLDRLGKQPSALHMVSVAHLVAGSPSNFDMLRNWRDPEQGGFIGAKFAQAERHSRLIELAQSATQRARIDGVLADCQIAN